jgi:hypothetical protein
MSSLTIRRVPDMIGIALGKSSDANERRAARKLELAAMQNDMRDPFEVTPKSSDLVLTVLFDHVRMDSADGTHMLGKDSMGALIQGLQRVYDKAGHEGNWTVLSGGTATGNPTRGNIHLARLRKAHRSRLAEFGRTSCRAMPLTDQHVAEHYRLTVSEIPAAYDRPDGPRQDIQDIRPWALHALWVVGLHCGLRFDELAKLQMSGIALGRQICMTLPVRTKNSSEFKIYQFIDWPNARLQSSHAMDPNLALNTWLQHRGLGPGFVFCDVFHTGRVNCIRPWDHKSFFQYMRGRLRNIGLGSDIAARFSGHSIKRGSVQLYRKIGMTDVWIMQRINMVGEGAYTRYTEMYNDAVPVPVPTFASVAAAVEWAKHGTHSLGDMLDDEEEENDQVESY